MRETSRIDADQVRFRVFKDGEYFQFTRAVSEATAEQVVRHLALRGPPLDGPTKAIEMLPDLDGVAKLATSAEDGSYEMGDLITSWRDNG